MRKMHPDDISRVSPVLDALADNPRPHNSEPLTGEVGFKIRAGDYRVVYEVDYDAKEVLVRYVEHRSKVYRKH